MNAVKPLHRESDVPLTSSSEDARRCTTVLLGAVDIADSAIDHASMLGMVVETVRDTFGWPLGASVERDRTGSCVTCTVMTAIDEADLAREAKDAWFAAPPRDWKRISVEESETRTHVVVPVAVGETMVGSLHFFVNGQVRPQYVETLESIRQLLSSASNGLTETKRQKEIAANARAVGAVLGTAGIVSVAEAALAAVRSSFAWGYASYWTLDEDGDGLVISTDTGTIDEDFHRATAVARFGQGEGLVGQAWKRRGLVYYPDVRTLEDVRLGADRTKTGLRSAVAIPVVVRGRVVGVMDFFTVDATPLSGDRLSTLNNVGRLVSDAIERASDAERHAELGAVAGGVSKVLSALHAAQTPDEVMTCALRTICAAFGWIYGAAYKLDAKASELVFLSDTGQVSEELRELTLASRFARGKGLPGHAWSERKVVHLPQVSKLPDGFFRAAAVENAGLVGGACIPLFVGKDIVGAIELFTNHSFGLSEAMLDGLRNVGRIVSAALERASVVEGERIAQATLREKVDRILPVLKSAARGDLSHAVDVTGNDVIGQMAEGLRVLLGAIRASVMGIDRHVGRLSTAAGELNRVADRMHTTADETSGKAGVVSAASAQVSVNVQTVAVSADEMTANIGDIARSIEGLGNSSTRLTSVSGRVSADRS